MQQHSQLTTRLAKLLAESESALKTISHSTSTSSTPLEALKERFQELIIGLEGILTLNEVAEQEDGGSVVCEELLEKLSKEPMLTQLSITVETPFPPLYINSARLLGSLRWLFRGAIRNGHSHAHISSKDRDLLITLSSTRSPPLQRESLEYLIANEMFSFYEHSFSWREDEESLVCSLPIFDTED